MILERRPDVHDSAIQHMVALGCVAIQDEEVYASQEKRRGQAPDKVTPKISIMCSTQPSGKGSGAASSASGESDTQSLGTQGLEWFYFARRSSRSFIVLYMPSCSIYAEMVKPFFWQYIFQKLNPSNHSIQAQRALSRNP
eukprot:2495247-Amphidinium_carterae.1